MAIYRLMKNLSFGERLVKRGSIKRLGLDEETITILLKKGAIARISSPPIQELPGWGERGRKLEELGVLLVEHLLEKNEAKIAERMGETTGTIRAWKKELTEWLKPPPPEPDG